ncbi:hypothetical protein ABMA28_012709 [Loxostege sticticalis]|uniref:Uncharacterized protein n=1 Tax=Loxostege sticticalis TaxID=481309 RepID=A0ABD0S4W4_LOXSC
MRLFLTLLLFATIHCVLSKNNVKSLTESMGHEVIEIGAPIKELPPDLEEEPSVENDEDDKPTTVTLAVATKRDYKKTTTLSTADGRRKNKDVDKTTTKQDDEEARIEKELAEIYKDNIDYKSDSSEQVKDVSVTPLIKEEEVEPTLKPVLRQQNAKKFKFQPNLDNKEEVERFRTSVDEISCEKKDQMKVDPTPQPGSANGKSVNFLLNFIAVSALIFN